MKISTDKRNLIISGLVIGAISVLLVILGNPKNMGFCIACFVRDIAGAAKMHSAAVVQYVRPEIIGLILGSLAISLVKKEFRPRGGSSPFLRLVIGAFVMIGALTFLGCPFRMILRLAGGDLNALVALFGFACGIAAGCFFLNNGFSLGRTKEQSAIEGAALPAINAIIFILSLAVPALFAFSEKGPGASHAPVIISLSAGLAVGILAQRTRLCMVGGIRDIILVRDFTLILGFAAIFLSALIMNIASGSFQLGFENQPIAHTAHVWNFLGMFIVGLGSVMIGGCPLRQIIMAGEGSTDSAMSVTGMFIGAAVSHNFGLVGNATADGPNAYGKTAVIAIIVILLLIAYGFSFGKKRGR
ncbi:MAG: YedE family putative selenium transporter [Candidatus Ornithospirochaeta sp.]|nr:YedE family putative selenium transporter [Candidatus Ornithospirochaeta sp.]